MYEVMRKIVLIASCAVMAGCGSPSDAPKDQAATTTTAVAPAVTAAASGRPAIFVQCAACHSVEHGRNGVGPSLAGVAGGKAAAAPGFSYSPALKAKAMTWDDATLDQWLTGPQKLVPGTRMAFAGMANPEQRRQLIEYLKTLK